MTTPNETPRPPPTSVPSEGRVQVGMSLASEFGFIVAVVLIVAAISGAVVAVFWHKIEATKIQCKKAPCKIEKCLSTDGVFFGGVCTNKQVFDGVCEYDCERVPK